VCPSLACSIVFANKTVFTVMGFKFVYTLTLLHVLTTLVGMRLFAALGFYERKALPVRPLLSLSASFVGYIVFWNLSLQVCLMPSPASHAPEFDTHVQLHLHQMVQGRIHCEPF
jgi:hypothetical protein